jgi:hypothetical protein
MSQLHPLPTIIHPGKINIKCRLDDAEDDANGVRFFVVGIELPPDPVEDIEGPVGTEG